MCNCNKNISGWTYTTPDGANTYTYRTEIEAMAHYYRMDGQGTVEPKMAAKV